MRQALEQLKSLQKKVETPEERDLRNAIIQMCELYLAASEGALENTVTIAERLSSTKVVSIDRREPSQLDLHLAHFKRQPGAYLAEQARSIRFCVQMGMRGLPLSGRWAEAGKVAWIAVSMWYHWLALAVAALCPASRRWEARHINRLLALMEPMAA